MEGKFRQFAGKVIVDGNILARTTVASRKEVRYSERGSNVKTAHQVSHTDWQSGAGCESVLDTAEFSVADERFQGERSSYVLFTEGLRSRD